MPPLDVSGLNPVEPVLDVSGLESMNTAGLVPVDQPRPSGFFGGVKEGFVEGLTGAPESAGAGIEAAGVASGIRPLETVGKAIQDATKRDPASRPRMVPLREFFDAPGTFIGQQLGQGVGSSVPTLATGAAGAAAGTLVTPGVGTLVGGLLGAALPALPMNTGDLYKQLIEEGVDRERAANLAVTWGPVLTAPDVFSASSLLKPFLGTAKEAGAKGLARLLARRAKDGAKIEGLTELGQQGIQETIAGTETGNPDLINRAERVATAGIAGTLGGGTMGGIGGVVESRRRSDAPATADGGAEQRQPTDGPAPGTVIGVSRPGGPPERGVVESVVDGYVFWRDEAGERRADPVDEFLRDAVAAPPAVDAVMGDATTVGEPDARTTENIPPADLLDEGDPVGEVSPGRRDPAEVAVLRAYERATELDQRARKEQRKLDVGAANSLPQAAIDQMTMEAQALRDGADARGSQPASDMAVARQGELTLDAPTPQAVEAAAAETNTAPSEAQKAAGNYAKGSVKWRGLDIAIENPRGSTRSGTGPDGSSWSVQMPAHYGYVRRTEGKDGDQVDVYLGDNPQADTVFVVDQVDPATGKFDEHKAFLGFENQDQAEMTYASAFSDGTGPQRMGAITAMPFEEFRTWVRNGQTKKPVSDSAGADSQAKTVAPQGGATLDVSADSVETADTNERPPSAEPSTLSSGFDPIAAFQQIGRLITGLSARNTAAAARIPVGAPDSLQRLSSFGRFLSFGAGLASRDAPSARYFNAILNRDRQRETIENSAIPLLKPYYDLQDAGQTRVNQILEHDRILGIERRNNGRRVVIQTPANYRGELASPNTTVALSTPETAALFGIRQFADRRLMDLGAAMAREQGYRGEFSAQGIAAQPPSRQTARAAAILEAVTDARRRGYVPFNRYGDYYVKILPRHVAVPGRDAMPPRLADGRYEFVDTVGLLSSLTSERAGSSPKKVADRVRELESRYPRDRFTYEIGRVTPKSIQALDIPLVEKLFAAVNMRDQALGGQLYDDVLSQIYNERLAGFRKQSENVPGYSTDFQRALGDYNRQSASVIANMDNGRAIEDAYTAVEKHPDRNVRDYWKAHRAAMDNGKGDFSALRKFGFFNFLWASPSSAIINLTQTPFVTGFQLGTWAGVGRGQSLANRAGMEALGAIRPTSEKGVTLDFSRLGRTPAERLMLEKLRTEGVLDPSIANEMAGNNISKYPSLRPAERVVRRVWDIGASMFNAAEQANRVAAALAYFRAAQSEALRKNLAKVYASDQNFRQAVGRVRIPEDRSTPRYQSLLVRAARLINEGRAPNEQTAIEMADYGFDDHLKYQDWVEGEAVRIARWGVDETQFIGGKINRQPIQRGAGALAFQFQQYPANYLRLLYKNFTRMGHEGKLAGTLMLLALVAGGGLLGFPFADDILGATQWAVKTATGIDPLLERRLMSFLQDMGFNKYAAEALVYGGSRSLTGVDLSKRIGMGDIAPKADLMDVAGPVASIAGDFVGAMGRYATGQPVAGALELAKPMIGKGPYDVAKATIQWPAEGYSTRRGEPVVMPSEISGDDMAKRALGFQPAEFAREGTARYEDMRLKEATKEASTKLLTAVARHMALAEDARRMKDEAGAREHEGIADAILAKNAAQFEEDGPDWSKVPPPTARAIRQRVARYLEPRAAAVKGAPRLKREEMQREVFPRR